MYKLCMPELPEVQTIVSDLNKKVAGRCIIGAWLDWPKMLKLPNREGGIQANAENFKENIIGSKITGIRRRGKNVLIYLRSRRQSANLLLIHQKLTGHILVGRWEFRRKKRDAGGGQKEKIVPLEPRAVVEDPHNSYIHLILYLDNGKMLALSDLRKFAKVVFGSVETIEKLPELVNLGPEATAQDLNFAKFVKLIQPEKRKIKQVLMDQEVIAGIGNIYSDDILWTARIHPFKSANKLSVMELKDLYRAMRMVLTKAIKLRGTSISDFRDTAGEEGGYTANRLVYRREGEQCLQCRTIIKRIKLGGRSAHFCPKCQKL